MGIEQLQK